MDHEYTRMAGGEEITYKLVETCGACPEQYDVFIGEAYVAYLRLRHGRFTVDCPFGVTIWTAFPKGDGIFEWEERDTYLTQAIDRIHADIYHWAVAEGES